MLGVGDRDQLAGRRQRRVVQVVLDAEVNVELHAASRRRGVPFLAVHRRLADFAAESFDHHVVFFQHVVGVHLVPIRRTAARRRAPRSFRRPTGPRSTAAESPTGPAAPRPIRASNRDPCQGHTIRPRSTHPSAIGAARCGQNSPNAETSPGSVWHTTSPTPSTSTRTRLSVQRLAGSTGVHPVVRSRSPDWSIPIPDPNTSAPPR